MKNTAKNNDKKVATRRMTTQNRISAFLSIVVLVAMLVSSVGFVLARPAMDARMIANELSVGEQTPTVRNTVGYSVQNEHGLPALDRLNSTQSNVAANLSQEQKGEIKDADGNFLVPFDVAYPEEFNSGNHEYRQDAILLKMPNEYAGDLTESLSNCGIVSMEFSVKTANGAWYEAMVSEGTDVTDVMKSVRGLDEVLMADYDYVYRTAEVEASEGNGSAVDGINGKVLGNGQVKNQWYLKSSGIQEAWKELEKNGLEPGGLPSVVVAVIDTGVDYNHPDLKNNIWVNTGEIPDNGIDDDGNGYIDDYYGYNTVANKGSGMDVHGHGTHVAGIIAASNNKEGIVGIAYNAKIMPITAGQATGIFLQNDIAEAIIYAYEMGADVINMSFGGSACSIAVQDALMTAYTRSTLVASAGNDGMPNQPTDFYDDPLPNYPGALSYVIGVMSVNQQGIESGFTNWDVYPFNSLEYEVYAPGEQIYSTLAGGGYGNLSGTSMAAPVVSGMAALLRSYFTDRDMYPSKFIQAQICATSEDNAICCNPDMHTVNGLPHNLPMIANAHDALTKLPKPDVNLYDYYIFDGEELSDKNNGDGIADAGETIDIVIVLRNRWGMSENTVVTIDALSDLGVVNPYVEILIDSENYDSVGTYSTKSMLIYDADNFITGYTKPLRVKISEDCPNDYRIGLNVTTTCGNALDEKDEATYSNLGALSFDVRSGVILPSQITEDTTLTKDNLYIIPNSTYIAKGVTVTVEPGTRIQFWSDDPGDVYAQTAIAYLNVEGSFITKGTLEEPVELFPSDLMSQYRVEIKRTGDGRVDLSYTTVTNAYLDINTADHCTFRQNYADHLYYRHLSGGVVSDRSGSAHIYATSVSNSMIYKCYRIYFEGAFDTCAFIDSDVGNSSDFSTVYTNCAFIGNYITREDGYISVSSMTLSDDYIPTVEKIVKDVQTGTTYLQLRIDNPYGYSCNDTLVEYHLHRSLAQYMGGDLVCIESERERAFLQSNDMQGMVGLIRGSNTWVNGAAIPEGLIYDYGSCYAAQYSPYSGTYTDGVYRPGGTCTFDYTYSFLVELPGSLYCETIQLKEGSVEIDMESSYQPAPTVIPATFDVKELVYVSEDPSVVTVDQNGLVTPVAKGETRVFVYAPDYQCYAVMTVKVVEKVKLENLTLPTVNATLQLGDTINLEPIFTPSNTTQRTVTYATSDEGVLQVDAMGRVTAVGVGTATVTATAANGLSATYTAKVITPIASISFADKFYVTFVGDTDTEWKPTVFPANADDYTLTWLSSNPEVAYVNEAGDLVRVAPGPATIRVQIDGTQLYADLNITVSNTNEVADTKVVEMDSREGIQLAVTDDHALWVWGYGVIRLPIKAADGVKDAIICDYSSNYARVYILKTDGTVECGEITYATGKYTALSAYDQSEVADLTNVVALERDNSSYYALRADGTVWAWGNNYYGQLGDGTTATRSKAVQVGVNNVKKVVPFYESVLLLTNDNKAYLYGTDKRYTEAQPVAENAEDIRAGYHAVVALADGRQLSVSHYGAINTITDHTDRDYYSYNSCSFSIKGETVYWNGESIHCPGIEEVLFIITNDLFYYRTVDGKLYGVGSNSKFELANLSQTRSDTPVRIFLGLGSSNEAPVVENVNLSEDKLTDDALVLDFDKAVIAGNEYGYIVLKDSYGNMYSLDKTLVLDKLNIASISGFVHGETYTLTVPKGAMLDVYGNKVEAITYTFTYTNTEPIQRTEASIADGAVLSNTDIDLSFGYTVANKGTAFDSIAITGNGVKAEGITVALENNTLTFKGTLDYGDYTLTVPAGALCDNVGGENKAMTVSFSVVRTLKQTAASVSDGEERVDERENITFTFEGAIKGASFDAISLKAQNGTAVPVTVTLVDGVLTVAHNGLAQGTAYTLTIPEGALADAIGTVNKEITIHFTTYAPAAIAHASTAAGNKDLALAPVFRFIYNGEFTLDESKLTLTDKDGSTVALQATLEGKVLTVTPVSALASDTVYTLALEKGLMTDERGATSVAVSYTLSTVKQTERFFWNEDNITTEIKDWIKGGYNTPGFIGNAILNNYQDTNVEHWLRITAGSYQSSDSYMKSIGLAGNWWGTINEELIGLQILDFDDFQSLADINFKNYLTKAPENTFPFVTQAYLLNKDGERVDRVTNETVTFVVEFNRDMDTTVPLRVRFGSSIPYGEYEINGEYVSPRRWEGTYTLKTTIENGRQRINIENGRAADDHYLVLMEPDSCRFGFEIDTTGAQAMMMQAAATATGIELSWTQDDFDTLAGYNVYRSTSEDGLYVRLNDFVIPADVTTFFDNTVEPGVRYFYNFTVVKTDFSESTPSGKINLMSMDTMAPGIYHSPVRNAFTGSNLIVNATVTDNLVLREVKLFYRTTGTEEWKSITMTNLNDRWSAVIIAENLSIDGLEYYIRAFDGLNYTYSGSATTPYAVTVQLAIDASAKGDVNGDGVITNVDALMLLQAANDKLNLTTEQFMRADLNEDGELSAAEALRILKYANGSITTLMG